VVKIFIKTSQYLFEEIVIIYYLADGMDHITSLIVHIRTAFPVHSIGANDRYIIMNTRTQPLCIGITRLFSILALYKQGF